MGRGHKLLSITFEAPGGVANQGEIEVLLNLLLLLSN